MNPYTNYTDHTIKADCTYEYKKLQPIIKSHDCRENWREIKKTHSRKPPVKVLGQGRR